MPWKKRNDNIYYYRSKRTGGRVVSEYVGGGFAGFLFARLDEEERDERNARRVAEREEREPIDAVDRAADALLRDALTLADRQLRALGFHRDRKRVWRLKRRGRPPGRQDA